MLVPFLRKLLHLSHRSRRVRLNTYVYFTHIDLPIASWPGLPEICMPGSRHFTVIDSCLVLAHHSFAAATTRERERDQRERERPCIAWQHNLELIIPCNIYYKPTSFPRFIPCSELRSPKDILHDQTVLIPAKFTWKCQRYKQSIIIHSNYLHHFA